MPLDCTADLRLGAGNLQVEMDTDRRRRQIVERFVEMQLVVRSGHTRMADDEPLGDVELDEVGSDLNRHPQRLERVLGRERCGASMADDERTFLSLAQNHLRSVNFDRGRTRTSA